jgi:predicted nucleic acid-binding protein
MIGAIDKELLRKANEWWDGLEEDQKNVYLDEWVLEAYKEMIED